MKLILSIFILTFLTVEGSLKDRIKDRPTIRIPPRPLYNDFGQFDGIQTLRIGPKPTKPWFSHLQKPAPFSSGFLGPLRLEPLQIIVKVDQGEHEEAQATNKPETAKKTEGNDKKDKKASDDADKEKVEETTAES